MYCQRWAKAILTTGLITGCWNIEAWYTLLSILSSILDRRYDSQRMWHFLWQSSNHRLGGRIHLTTTRDPWDDTAPPSRSHFLHKASVAGQGCAASGQDNDGMQNLGRHYHSLALCVGLGYCVQKSRRFHGWRSVVQNNAKSFGLSLIQMVLVCLSWNVLPSWLSDRLTKLESTNTRRFLDREEQRTRNNISIEAPISITWVTNTWVMTCHNNIPLQTVTREHKLKGSGQKVIFWMQTYRLTGIAL